MFTVKTIENEIGSKKKQKQKKKKNRVQAFFIVVGIKGENSSQAATSDWIQFSEFI